MEDWIKHIERVKLAEIQRDIFLYTTVKTACSLCTTANAYDSIKDASFRVTCSECQGRFWVITHVPNAVPARVHWVNDEMIQATPGGKYYAGDAWAKISARYLDLAKACQEKDGKVVVDGNEMTIVKNVPIGAFDDNLYRLILKRVGTPTT